MCIDEEEDDYEIQYNIKWNTERQKDEYLIDRKGKIHRYLGDLTKNIYSFHHAIARQVLGDDFKGDPLDHLYITLGWVMVGSSVYDCPIIDKEPSQAQIDMLFDLGLYDRLCIHKGDIYSKYKDMI